MKTKYFILIFFIGFGIISCFASRKETSQVVFAQGQAAITPQNPPRLFLPLISGGGGQGGNGQGDSGETADIGAVWLPFTKGDGTILPTYGADIAVDSLGRIHVVYTIYTGTDEQGNQPATYAFCALNCTQTSNWTFTPLGNAVQDARIALGPDGSPQIMLYGPVYDPTWPRMRYQYAVCKFDCTNSSQWVITTIATPIEPTATREYNNNHYFAVDPQGHPALIYTDTVQNDHPGTFYVWCEVNCTNANQWVETLLNGNTLYDKPSLSFSSQGQPRVAFGYFDDNSDEFLAYIQCNVNCTDIANWSGTMLVQIHGSAKFNLAVNANGQPRMGVFTGAYAYNPFESQKLLYLWCDSGCSSPENWWFADVGMSNGSGDGVDLVLDKFNQPRMSFETSSQGLGYAWCVSNCESDHGSWQSQEVESQIALADNYEVLPTQRCTVSTWFNGQRSSLALDPSGNPRIGYDAQHWWYGTENIGGVPHTCNYQDVTVTRISIINQP